MVRIKRVYEVAAADDGVRILVDRLWPRGLSARRAGIDRWLKDLAPSDQLRRWFGHDPGRWPEFRSRYAQELRAGEKRALLDALVNQAASTTVTLLYAARDSRHNNAVVLRDLLETRLRKG